MASSTPLAAASYRFILNRTPTARFFMTRVGVGMAENPSKMRLTSPETRQWFSSVTRGCQAKNPQITWSMKPWQRQYSTEKDAPPKSTLGKEHFEKLIRKNKVVVFMKGVPDEPRCGFSNAVVQILRMHGVTNYDSHNVLEDESIRQGVKDYTNWPTIPQVFINGEFVGGCDILIEMHKSGELVEQLKKVGIKSALLEADEFKGKGKGSNDKK